MMNMQRWSKRTVCEDYVKHHMGTAWRSTDAHAYKARALHGNSQLPITVYIMGHYLHEALQWNEVEQRLVVVRRKEFMEWRRTPNAYR